MLEQIVYKSSRVSEERQVVYQVGDLESLSATALYYGTGGSGFSGGGFGGISKSDMVKYKIMIPDSVKSSESSIPEMKYFDEDLRFDSHPPLGNHLNYETWLKLTGPKKGRYLNLDNIHLPLDEDE